MTRKAKLTLPSKLIVKSFEGENPKAIFEKAYEWASETIKNELMLDERLVCSPTLLRYQSNYKGTISENHKRAISECGNARLYVSG